MHPPPRAPALNRIALRDSGLVYRNAQPFLRSRQAFCPTITAHAGGKVVVAMDIGAEREELIATCAADGPPEG